MRREPSGSINEYDPLTTSPSRDSSCVFESPVSVSCTLYAYWYCGYASSNSVRANTAGAATNGAGAAAATIGAATAAAGAT